MYYDIHRNSWTGFITKTSAFTTIKNYEQLIRKMLYRQPATSIVYCTPFVESSTSRQVVVSGVRFLSSHLSRRAVKCQINVNSFHLFFKSIFCQSSRYFHVTFTLRARYFHVIFVSFSWNLCKLSYRKCLTIPYIRTVDTQSRILLWSGSSVRILLWRGHNIGSVPIT